MQTDVEFGIVLKINKEDFEIQISRGVGSTLEDFLRSADERLWIVSPWISPEYAEFIVSKKNDGLDVQLATSLESSNRGAFQKLIEKRKKKTEEKILGFIPFEKTNTYFVPLLGEDNFVVFKPGWRGTRKERFTHTKIYVCDNGSAIGSVNLTKAGLWDNVETLWLTKDSETTEKIGEAFQNIKTHPLMEKASIREIVEYAHIPDEEIEKQRSELEKFEDRLRKKADRALKNIFS